MTGVTVKKQGMRIRVYFEMFGEGNFRHAPTDIAQRVVLLLGGACFNPLWFDIDRPVFE